MTEIGKLHKGDEVKVLKDLGDVYKVRVIISKDGYKNDIGFVYKKYVK